MPQSLRGGATTPGGVTGYPLERLRQEVAILALHFHWSYETIMEMEHQERRLWVGEIARLTESRG